MMKKFWESFKALIFSEYAPLVLIYIISEINLIASFVLSYKAVGSFKGLFDNLSSVVMPNLFNNIFVKAFVGLILLYIIIIIIKYFCSKERNVKFSIFLIITLLLTIFAGVCTYTAMFYDQNNLGQLVYRVLYFNFMKDGHVNIKFTLYILYLLVPGICVLYTLIKLGKKNNEPYLRHLLITIMINTFGLMIVYFIVTTLLAYVWALILAGICAVMAYYLGVTAVQDAIELGENQKNKKQSKKKISTKKGE